MTRKRMRIVIADDHPVVRRGLRAIVEDALLPADVHEAGNAAELLTLVRKREPDVVLLDIAMPGRSGLEALKELRREHPKIPMLVLSIHSADEFAVRSIKAGASGYLTKDSAPEELIDAIRTVVAGRRYLTPSVAERLASAVESDAKGAPHEMLSDREFHVLRMLAVGKTNGEVAGELALSAKTISTYRTRTLRKMGMRTNAELAQYAVRHGLV
jgi:two-component system, NarL family, invasion response regulator UvrY